MVAERGYPIPPAMANANAPRTIAPIDSTTLSGVEEVIEEPAQLARRQHRPAGDRARQHYEGSYEKDCGDQPGYPLIQHYLNCNSERALSRCYDDGQFDVKYGGADHVLEQQGDHYGGSSR